MNPPDALKASPGDGMTCDCPHCKALLDRIDAARALHVPAKKGGVRCQRCGEIVPCSTERVLDGAT